LELIDLISNIITQVVSDEDLRAYLLKEINDSQVINTNIN
jgi:hypothetical protein